MNVDSVEELVRIAAAGGGFRVGSGDLSVELLVRIAAAASGHGARLEIEDRGALSTEELVRIAAAGKGAVFFT